jgi:hypothetical protein
MFERKIEDCMKSEWDYTGSKHVTFLGYEPLRP